MAPLVWLITGCTSGSGLALVHAITARGDLVIATGRKATARLAHVKSDSVAVADLDVTAPPDEVQQAVASAVALFGRVDVLVNNAGISRLASLEEAAADLLAQLFEVNLFGAIKTTQAVLPFMRAARSGTIVFMGAGLGWLTMPFFNNYAMTKAALTIFAEGLRKEIAPFGLRSVIFEPGGFDSNLTTSREDDTPFAQMPQIEGYAQLFARTFSNTTTPPALPGDIGKLPDAIIDVVKGEGLARGRPFPVRVVLGPDALDGIRQKCNEQLQLLDEWEDVSLSVTVEGRRETSRWLLDGCSILNKSTEAS